jgi:hypothetical protein
VNRKDFVIIFEEDDLIGALLERWLVEASYTVSCE